MKFLKNRYLKIFLSIIVILIALIFLQKIFKVINSKIELLRRDREYKKNVTQINALITNNKFINTENNIILITIDTLRADRLKCYGYHQVETPNIDKLAHDGALFYNTVTVAPITCVSHSSILTGLYPYRHQVRDNANFYLHNKYDTLAEILKANGYTTAAFPSVYVLHSKYNLNQGFDYYDDEFLKPTSNKEPTRTFKGQKIYKYERPADQVTLQFLKWLISTKNKKFFAWIHFFDPHAPYNPPPKHRKKYYGNKSKLYDGEIAFVDECIGYILKYINNFKVNNNTLIVLTADHGESLGEKQMWGHNHVIYDDLLKVPLIFYFPQKIKNPIEINNQVRTIDIMPTVLDLEKIRIPSYVEGNSLSPLITGTNNSHTDNVAFSENVSLYIRGLEGFKELRYSANECFSIRTNNWKIIKHFNPKENICKKTELYNLIEDPNEYNNIYNKLEKSSQINLLFKKLDTFINNSKIINRKATNPVDQEAKKALKSLGYLQ